MDINEIKNSIFEKANELGFTDCEIYIIKASSFMVNVLNSNIDQYKNADLQGIGLRGIYNGKMGYSFSEKVDLSIVDLLLENAKNNSLLIESTEEELIYDGNTTYEKYEGFNEELEKVDVSEKIKLTKKIEEIALKEDERVKLVPYCRIGTAKEEIFIYNSKGLKVSSKSNYCYALAYIQAQEKESIKMNGEVWIGKSFKDFDVEKLAKKAVKKTLDELNGEKVKTGEYNIVLKNDRVCDLLGVFKSNFYAYKVQKGLSKLKNKLDKKIASDLINLIDTGIYKDNVGNEAFDSEGVKKEKVELIENGILKNYLYTLKTAKKDGVEPTGNGFKGSFKGTVSTRNAIMYIKEGKDTFENILKEMDNGIYVTGLAGLHSGANSISGDFSLVANGFLIENGKIVKPVEQFTIAGNFFSLLENVVAVGNDLKFGMPAGGTLGAPSLYVGKLSVAGE